MYPKLSIWVQNDSIMYPFCLFRVHKSHKIEHDAGIMLQFWLFFDMIRKRKSPRLHGHGLSTERLKLSNQTDAAKLLREVGDSRLYLLHGGG